MCDTLSMYHERPTVSMKIATSNAIVDVTAIIYADKTSLVDFPKF